MVNHVVNGYGESILIAKDDITERVSDENHVNTSLVNNTCRRIIVSRKHADR